MEHGIVDQQGLLKHLMACSEILEQHSLVVGPSHWNVVHFEVMMEVGDVEEEGHVG